MSLPATVKWVLLALLGLVIAIAVAIAAANLTSRQIGIASESVSAGDALAPSLSVPGERPAHVQPPDHSGEEEPTTTTTVPSESPTTTVEEPALPPEEAAEPPAEGGDDRGGHGSDGDD